MVVLLPGDGDDVEEDGNIKHGEGLQNDTDDERALATERVDQEQSADDGGNELDNTEDGSAEQRCVGASDADDLEQIVGIDSDGRSARPASEELCEVGKEETVRVALDAEDLANHALPAHTGSGFLLLLERTLDTGKLFHNVRVGGLHAAKLAQVGKCLLGLADLDEETGRLDGPDRCDQDDNTEHEVDRCGQEPARGVVSDGRVDLSTVVGKVGNEDSEVDRASESASAQSTNGCRRDLTQVDRADDDSLANADTSEETTEVDELHVSAVGHEDGNTD